MNEIIAQSTSPIFDLKKCLCLFPTKTEKNSPTQPVIVMLSSPLSLPQSRQSAKHFLQLSVLGLPHPLTADECVPPFGYGGRGSQFRRGDIHFGILYIYVLCDLYAWATYLSVPFLYLGTAKKSSGILNQFFSSSQYITDMLIRRSTLM